MGQIKQESDQDIDQVVLLFIPSISFELLGAHFKQSLQSLQIPRQDPVWLILATGARLECWSLHDLDNKNLEQVTCWKLFIAGADPSHVNDLLITFKWR